MLMEGLGNTSPANDYTYNGKELNEDFGLNLYGYGARWYDAAVGRWWSLDLMTESGVFFSAYGYVMNNPLSMFDPTGMYAWSGMEGSGAGDFWQSSQQERADDMKRKDEANKNYYVLIRDKNEVGEFFSNTTATMGTFNIVIASSFTEAESMVSKKRGKNAISTLVINSHGSEKGGAITTDATDPDNQHGITGKHMEAYLDPEGGKVYPNSFNQIKALENLLQSMDYEKSICVFMTCALAKGEDGKKFMDAVGYMVIPRNATIYFNQDWSNPLNADNSSKTLQIWQGPFGISNSYLNLGWTKLVTSYRGVQTINLKSGSHTGDIYLDSRPGKETVNEMKK